MGKISRQFGVFDIVRFIYHLPNFASLYWRLWKDPRVSWLARSMLILALLYVLLPLDAIVDWAPLVGQIDDLAVIALALRAFIRLIPKDVVKEHVAAIDKKTIAG
ncbi:MAG: DUF1232 domain-containing protein [Armatimonadota bacterium]|nr:DUF1232 domain-containing protein [Armatimonadota bacterium]